MGGWLDGWDGFDGQNGQNGWMTGWLDGWSDQMPRNAVWFLKSLKYVPKSMQQYF